MAKSRSALKSFYCGTPLGGKTSNLLHVHRRLDESLRGDMISVATASNRTLFFDYLPVNAVEIAGYETRFQLYTVPGQRVYDQTREIVLRGADGLVFVSDSAPERMEENMEALTVTGAVLNRLGQSLSTIPLVFQHNKRDLAQATPLPAMNHALNRRNLPSFPAVATSGYQVFSTLEAVTQMVLRRFHQSQERLCNSNTDRQQATTAPRNQEQNPVPAAASSVGSKFVSSSEEYDS